jgi:signal peptidase I
VSALAVFLSALVLAGLTIGPRRLFGKGAPLSLPPGYVPPRDDEESEALVAPEDAEWEALEPPEPTEVEDEDEVPAADTKPKRRLRGLAGWAVYLTVIIVAILLGPQFMTWALSSDHPIATVSGDSMWPALSQGDIVLLKGVSDIEELDEGDIIGFRHPDGMAIHRIARIEGNEIIARGDANFRDDPPIGIEDVVGKVPSILGKNAKIPYLGHLTFLLGPLTKDTDELAGESSSAEDQGDDLSARQELQ